MSNRIPGVYAKETVVNPSVNSLYEEVPVIIGKATTGPTAPTEVYTKIGLATLFGPEIKEDFGLTAANKILTYCNRLVYCRVAHKGDKAQFKDSEKVVFEAKEGGTFLDDYKVKYTVSEDIVTVTLSKDQVVLEEVVVSKDVNSNDYIYTAFDNYSQYLRIAVAEDYVFSEEKELTTAKGSVGAQAATGKTDDLEVVTKYTGSAFNNYVVAISVSAQKRISAKIKKGTVVVDTVSEGDINETAEAFKIRFNQYNSLVDIVKYPAVKSCSVTLTGGDAGLNTNEDDYIGGTEQGLKALEDVASIEVGLLAVPGVSDAKVVKYAQNVASTRKDCVYIADPPIGLKSYQTACWANGAGVFAGGSLISTSYSCTYSPWVKDVDGFGDIVYLPPSAVVIAKMMENNQTKNVWDACAGTDGGSLDILGLEYNMDKNDSEILKTANVNPIIYTNSRGYIIMGDNTGLRVRRPMNPEPGASLSVRRLVNYIKKVITALSIDYCFKTNDSFTWDEFKLQVNPFLRNIKDNRGLYDYRIVLDETTVTAEKIDALEMPAILKLKPTRKAEVIDLGFTLYPYGVSFNTDTTEDSEV